MIESSNGRIYNVENIQCGAYPQSVKAGMNAHLAKPVEAKLLYKTIEKYI